MSQHSRVECLYQAGNGIDGLRTYPKRGTVLDKMIMFSFCVLRVEDILDTDLFIVARNDLVWNPAFSSSHVQLFANISPVPLGH